MTTDTQVRKTDSEHLNKVPQRRTFSPNIDIYETDRALVLLADLPGVEQNQLDVTLEKNTLTIRAKSTENKLSDHKLIYSEYDAGDFERAFTVSDELDRENIEAEIKNGVLRLTLPKSKELRPRKIDVRVA